MQAYYGGEAHCAEQLAASDDYDPSELVCPPCSNVEGAIQVFCITILKITSIYNRYNIII